MMIFMKADVVRQYATGKVDRENMSKRQNKETVSHHIACESDDRPCIPAPAMGPAELPLPVPSACAVCLSGDHLPLSAGIV